MLSTQWHARFAKEFISQVIAALLIIYRVAQGKGWTADTHAAISLRNASSTIQFNDMSALHAAESTSSSEKNTAKIADTPIQEIVTSSDSSFADVV